MDMSEEIKKTAQTPGAEGATVVAAVPTGESAGVLPAVVAEGGADNAGFARGKKPFGNKQKRRPCSFCANKISIDYKDVSKLKKYVTEKGKIIARRQTGLCARHQREVTQAIKRARNMSLL
jgi:small subunit ribosomal protein S18